MDRWEFHEILKRRIDRFNEIYWRSWRPHHNRRVNQMISRHETKLGDYWFAIEAEEL